MLINADESLSTSVAEMLPLVTFLTLTPAMVRLETFFKLYSQLARLASSSACCNIELIMLHEETARVTTAIRTALIILFFMVLLF